MIVLGSLENAVHRSSINTNRKSVLVLIELFLLGVTAEALRANIGWKLAISLQRGSVDPKFHVEGVAPTNHSSQKTRLNDLSFDIKIGTDLSSIDRQTEFSSLYRVCIPCSAVKIRNLTPSKIVPPEDIIVKLCIHDDIGEITRHTNFGFSRYSGSFSPNMRNITTLTFYSTSPCLAMQSAVLARLFLSVCPSVRLSGRLSRSVVLSRRLKIQSCGFQHLVRQSF